VEGSFADPRELIAGYWLIQVKSKEEAVQWALRAPNPHGPDAETNIELRQIFELDDFLPSEAAQKMRELDLPRRT
jgi:hypothetical protein